MGGMKFEYDENGATFAYFVLSFYAMVIIPCTYYFWPSKEAKSIAFYRSFFFSLFSLTSMNQFFFQGDKNAEELSCYEPALRKVHMLSADQPKKRVTQLIV
jgi:preprotein translocase subunit Sec63